MGLPLDWVSVMTEEAGRHLSVRNCEEQTRQNREEGERDRECV